MEEFVSSGVDEEFKSCLGEDEDWQDAEGSLSEGQGENNEEVSLKISEGYNGECGSALKISEGLEENDEPSLKISMKHIEESITLNDGLEIIVSECSLRLHEGIDQKADRKIIFTSFNDHDEAAFNCSSGFLEDNEELISVCDHSDVGSEFSVRLCEAVGEVAINCTLRLCEGEEDDSSKSSLISCESQEEDQSECSLRLCEAVGEVAINCTLRLCEGEDDDSLKSSLISCEGQEEEQSESLLRLCEDDEILSQCSLMFSEDHETDSLECLVKLENSDKDDNDDEFLVRVFSKGVSVSSNSELGTRISGIGVVLEKPKGFPFLQVQKKLDFCVEELVAELLALMDGLLEALRNDFKKVLAFTDSDIMYCMITKNDTVDDQLLIALQERIQEIASKLEFFVLRLVPRYELKRSLQLAQEATGTLSLLVECSECHEDKHQSKMTEIDCSHNLCFDCMSSYTESKIFNPQNSVKYPYERCTYSISNSVYRSLIPSTSIESLDGMLTETETENLWRCYCPFPDCSLPLSAYNCSSSRQISPIQSNNNCIECFNCCRLVCTRCQVPWHNSLRCEEYQSLVLEDRNADDITYHQLAQISSWRRCQQCRQMIELAEGCYHVTCRCGHEFCFSCGTEYRYGTQTCQCGIQDENTDSSLVPSEQIMDFWSWDCFNLLPGSTDSYTEQEKSQLALIQQFLAGGISLDNQNPYQSPPRSTDSYLDTIKDLNQLPWLESFISVIGDGCYQEDHIY